MTWLVAALLAVTALTSAGCGAGDGSSGGEDSGGRVIVSAAASLKKAFTSYGREFPDGDVRLSFAASDELAAQIRQGVKPDVYAAASTKLPAQLHDEGLVEKPIVFASNRLVIAVPAGRGGVRSIDDLARPGVSIAIGAGSVPVGSYTRELLARLGRDRSAAILDNVRSEEPDVVGVVGKVTQGAADAGFVYATDVAASGGRLRGIALPARLEPSVAYSAAVVKGAENPEGASAFIGGLLSGAGERALRRAGFEPPP